MTRRYRPEGVPCPTPLNQWEYLTRYTEDGRILIDNNLLERDIRIFATRKNWLQRYRLLSQDQRRHLQPDADLPRLWRRAVGH